MAILNFIIDNILINAAVILGLVALLGLILQKKPFADCLSGTFKTMMGFMVLSAGANVIVGALEPFSVWFAAGLGIDGAVASIEAVLAVAMQNEVVGRDIALVYAGIFVVNLILARFTKLKYVFLNGEAPIYIAMASILFGVGLCGFGHGLAIGIGAILALVGVLITAILLVKKVKGGILYGILITWVLGIVCELTGIYVPNPDAGMYSVIPTSFVSFDFSALGKTFGQVFKTDFSGVGILNFFAVMFSFLFVDLFDTLGTLIGVASKADMLDEDGKLPHIKGALMADSIATCAGAVLGTSTTTTFVESASGVTEGGRTGLTAMTTGVLFLLATIFSPLFLTIPSFATAPALIIVGFYMMGSAIKIDFSDPSEGIPAFLTILAMPTAYSISEGIAIGVISWTIVNVVTGKAKEKKISPLMYVLTVLFILKYVFL